MKNFKNLVLLLIVASMFSSCLVQDGRQDRGHGNGHGRGRHHNNHGHHNGW
jgi:hypothetical protein